MTNTELRPTPPPAASDASDLGMAMKISRIYFQQHLDEKGVSDYLASRCVSPTSIRRFELGYAPDSWRGLVDHFSSHRIRLAAFDAGVITKAANSGRLLDFFRDRLMFPIRSSTGELVGYGGRKVGSSEGPKYINTPETTLFQKGETLYGLYQNLDSIKDSGHALMVEGYMDVIALSTAGCHLGVAPMGTAVTPAQISILRENGVKTLWMCLDGDAAGMKAAERSISVIMENYDPRLEVRIINLTDGHDPDSLISEHGLDAFRETMKSALRLPEAIDRLCKGKRGTTSIEDKATYMLNLKPYIEMASGYLQNELIDIAATVTGLSKTELQEFSSVNEQELIVEDWNTVVADTACCLVNGEDKTLAAAILAYRVQGHGYEMLSELAEGVMAGEKVSNLLGEYAELHGPIAGMSGGSSTASFIKWARHESLNDQIDHFLNAPFDHACKEQIKGTLRLR